MVAAAPGLGVDLDAKGADILCSFLNITAHRTRQWVPIAAGYFATFIVAVLVPVAAHAQPTGRAEGLDVTINLVSLLGAPWTSQIGPTPVAELPAGGGADAGDLLAADIAALNLGTLVAANALHTETSSLPGNTTITSLARVNGLSVAGGLVRADQLTASCRQTVGGLEGSVEATNLNLVGAGVTLPAPNTVVNVAGLASVILNKQELATDGSVNTLTVTGLELRVLPEAGLGPGFGLVGSLLNLVVGLLNTIASVDLSLLTATCSMPATPTISTLTAGGVSPAVGPADGGTLVTIAGTHFVQGTTVTFGSASPVMASVQSSTQLTVTTPPHAAGSVAVTLSTPVGATVGGTTVPDGTASAPGGFTYLPSTQLTSITPSSGSTAGGYAVTLEGAFGTVQSVTFGSVPVASIVSASPTQIVIIAPPQPAGAAQVLVQTATGSTTGAFTYVSSPVITSVSPTHGGPGQTMTLTGSDFYQGLTVGLCAQLLTPDTAAAGPFTTVSVDVPACPAGGSQVVTLTNPDGGTAVAPVSFTYQDGPVITSVDPPTGTVEGGTVVTIAGSNLEGATEVTFGGVAATQVTVLEGSALMATTPAHEAGVVDVSVTTSAGTVTFAQGFTYKPFLPTECAEQFGLDPADTEGDPDGDGLTNMEECTSSPMSHPRGFFTRYFGEGAQSPEFFDTRLAILNVDTAKSANVLATFHRGDGTSLAWYVPTPAGSRRTIDVGNVPGMSNAEFATRIESDVPIVASRLMRWSANDRYGSHAESSISREELVWYLAEGATHSGFNLFYLIQNVQAVAASVDVEYLLGDGSSFTRTYSVPPRSRFNIWVNHEPGLESAEVSAVFRSTNHVPIIVERAMYRDAPGQYFSAGHSAAAIPAPQTTWYFAEGATGEFFDTFLLVANPHATPVSVEATYYLPNGQTIVRAHQIAPRSRYNIWVDEQEGSELADTAFSVRLVASAPVVAERAMWWPGQPDSWHEAHASFGTSAPHLRWGVAEGEVGGPTRLTPFLMIANPGAASAELAVTLYFEDGTRTSFPVAVAAASRYTIDLSSLPQASGRRFGLVVSSTNGVPTVVEWALYGDSVSGIPWAAGSSAPATPLP
jgi:hypothetical protein